MTINRSLATGFVSDTSLGSVTDTHAYTNYGEEQKYTASYGATQLYSADYGTRDGLGRLVNTVKGWLRTQTQRVRSGAVETLPQLISTRRVTEKYS